MENVKILTQELWDLIIRDDDGKKVKIEHIMILLGKGANGKG